MNFIYIKLKGTLSDALYQACTGSTLSFATGRELIVSVDDIDSDNKGMFKKIKQYSLVNCSNTFDEKYMKSKNLRSEFPSTKRSIELIGMFKNKDYFEHHRDQLYDQFEFKINPELRDSSYVYIDDGFIKHETTFICVINRLLQENKKVQIVINSENYDCIRTELEKKYLGNNNITIIDNISDYDKLCIMVSCKEGGYYTGQDLGFWASFFGDNSKSSEIIVKIKLNLSNNTSCFSNFGDNSYLSMTQSQFIEYFFPDIEVELVTSSNEPSDIFIMGIHDMPYDKKEKINMLICIENITNPNFTWYRHYNNFGEYGDKGIKIYIYNHIDKIIKTDHYIALPVIYFRMNYFRLKRDYYFNHPDLQIPFSKKKFALMINRSGLNQKITSLSNVLNSIGQVDNIHLYAYDIKKKSCYNSIELLKVLNQYKFIICFENSYINDGYITEKIFNCFFSNSIPLYSGSERIHDYFNSDSFINIDDSYDYMSIIKELNKNEQLYNQYISNKKINDSYNDENFLEEMKNYIDYELKNT